jgi:hypothetical protein
MAKCKTIGGVSYDVFKKLFDSLVSPIIEYGATIWGYKSYSYINAIHLRACKKIAPSGGRRENVWGISCEKSLFYVKKLYFFQLRREARKLLGYFV